MAYYPKNKIKTDQVSTGEYNLLSTGEVYRGFYYKLSNGKAFTGKFPGDGNNDELRINPDPLNVSPPPKSITVSSKPPLYPTDQDYKNGFFIRYFSKKRNEYIIEELTKSQYDELNKPSNIKYKYYKPFMLKWMLTGTKQTITDFNYYSIKTVEEKEKVYGLDEFLNKNYLQYYKEPTPEIQTNG